MEERGWGWPSSQTRRAQLIEWLVSRSAELPDGVLLSVEPFYRALPDQSMNNYVTALDDMNNLEGRALLELANSFGGIDSLAARAITPDARAFAEDLQAARGSKQHRRSACRDAMVDWLYSGDAVRPPGVVRDRMLQDPQRGYYYAGPFTADDLDTAAAWLHRQGLARGTMIDQAEGPVVLYLTDAGVKCAEESDSDTNAYLQRQQGWSPSPTVNIATNSAPFQVAGAYAHQAQVRDVATGHQYHFADIKGNLAAGSQNFTQTYQNSFDIAKVRDFAELLAEISGTLQLASRQREALEAGIVELRAAVNDSAADKRRMRRAVDAVMAPLKMAGATVLRQTAITMGTDVGNELDMAIRHMPHL